MVLIFSQHFFGPTKFARTTNMKILCDPEAGAGSHRCCPSTNIQNLRGGAQLFPRHTTCPRSHELLVSSRLRVPPLLPMLLWLVEWRRQRSGSGRRSRRCARSDFFWIHETHYLQYLLLSLVLWLWDSIRVIVPLTLARCFWGRRFFLPSSLPLLVPLSLYIYIYIYIYIFFLIFNCFYYWKQ